MPDLLQNATGEIVEASLSYKGFAGSEAAPLHPAGSLHRARDVRKRPMKHDSNKIAAFPH
jgi:hypothetical protein